MSGLEYKQTNKVHCLIEGEREREGREEEKRGREGEREWEKRETTVIL